jgi:hypothetical protein
MTLLEDFVYELYSDLGLQQTMDGKEGKDNPAIDEGIWY